VCQQAENSKNNLHIALDFAVLEVSPEEVHLRPYRQNRAYNIKTRCCKELSKRGQKAVKTLEV